MRYDRHNSAGYLANQMARLLLMELQNCIRPLGLAPAQFVTLLELWDEDGLTQKQLTERLGVEQATMANTLARMERDRLIGRKPNPNDARSQQIWLTAKARKLREPATRIAHSVTQKAVSDLTEEEVHQYFDLMRRVIATLQPERTENDE